MTKQNRMIENEIKATEDRLIAVKDIIELMESEGIPTKDILELNSRLTKKLDAQKDHFASIQESCEHKWEKREHGVCVCLICGEVW